MSSGLMNIRDTVVLKLIFSPMEMVSIPVVIVVIRPHVMSRRPHWRLPAMRHTEAHWA